MAPRRALSLALLLSASLAASPDWYGPFRYRSRVLLVFAPSPTDPRLAEQRRALRRGAAGGVERDVVPIEVVGDAADDARVRGRVLRSAYGVAPDAFAVVLIGKDGGEKMRATHPISEASLFETIDAMPMRRGEMKRQGQEP